MSAGLLSFLTLMALAQASVVQEGHSVPGSYVRELDYQVANVTYRIALAARPHCAATYPVTGLQLHHLAEYAARDRAEADSQFRLSSGPGVLTVVPGSPAARSGLMAGDVLLSVNGLAPDAPALLAAERDSEKRRKLIEASEARLEEQLRRGPARIEILRAGQRLALVLEPILSCEVRGRLARSSQANAFANGHTAIMTTRMLEFIENEDELAVVMAHEIAHNLLGHPARLESQKVPGGLLRGFGKNAARVHATEEEADRLGLRLLWAAGYDVSAAIPFWRRLYARFNPIPLPKLFRTHPSLGARERMIRQTIEELRAGATATH